MEGVGTEDSWAREGDGGLRNAPLRVGLAFGGSCFSPLHIRATVSVGRVASIGSGGDYMSTVMVVVPSSVYVTTVSFTVPPSDGSWGNSQCLPLEASHLPHHKMCL